MSKNFFAALDDSGDENEPKAAAPKKESNRKVKPEVVEPSKPDRRRQPAHGDRNTKGGRGGRAPARDGKRAYDRRSGTGRGREIKKGGGGARNWGNDKNDARKSEGAVTEGQEDAQLKEGETKKEEAAAAAQPEPEQEDKTMSYEEFLANKERPKSDAFADKEVREVENEFAKLTPKVAEEEDFLVMGGGKQKRTREKKEAKKTLVPGFKVASSNPDDRRSRRDGDRRGSGGGRGRVGRGGNRRDSRGRGGGRGRGGSQKEAAVNVADTEAFPSL